ncbi:LVIVD repeat-containing protein [Egicoccus sp. AB-alg2]|uniref:LVIVD repeat-containing protein n=1 Tax=Egicoccus sp. AB-alg2 TaxID=3242693 RepID=UPI00359D399F
MRRRTGRLLFAALAATSLFAGALPAAADTMPAEEQEDADFGFESFEASESAEAPQFPTTDDPRVGLQAGPGETAGQAILNLEKLASLPLAPGANTNSDLAFTGDYVISGNYNGFNVYDVSDPTEPQLRTSIICPGSQNDVSVYGDLLFMSVEATSAKIDCTSGGVTSANRFRGVRIWDISDIDNPVQLNGVQTCKGSHTHTIVEDPNDDDNVYVYVSGTAGIRAAAEPPFNCTGASSLLNRDTDNFSVTVIKVPLDDPDAAAIVNRNARIFSFCGDNSCEDDHANGSLNAFPPSNPQPLYPEGSGREPGGQSASQASTCHDITAYPQIGLAAGACQGRGLLIDITDPANPRRIDAVEDYNFAYWHSATFNNDGTKVIFTDEWGGGSGARCRATDPLTWGANALFDIVETNEGLKMEFASYFKLPMVQTNQENCVAHNGSLIPVPGRDIMVQAWYQGGTTVFDFTDSKNPVEIAYFDRGPNHPTSLQTGGFWSTYWHNGYMYGNEIGRGFDVFDLTTSEFLNEVEIAAAKQVQFDEYNVQGQERLVWPATFTTVRAWHSAAQRQGVLSAETDANLTKFIDRSEKSADSKNAAQRRNDAALLKAVGNQLGDSSVEQGLKNALSELSDTLR